MAGQDIAQGKGNEPDRERRQDTGGRGHGVGQEALGRIEGRGQCRAKAGASRGQDRG